MKTLTIADLVAAADTATLIEILERRGVKCFAGENRPSPVKDPAKQAAPPIIPKTAPRGGSGGSPTGPKVRSAEAKSIDRIESERKAAEAVARIRRGARDLDIPFGGTWI